MDLPDDVRRHRDWLLSLLAMPDAGAAGTVVDLGCGRGEDLRRLAERHPGDDLRLVGLDLAERGVAIARSATRDPRVGFAVARLDGRLPLADASVDAVYSHNLLECLPDADGFAAEVARVLRPGGRLVVAHWDWDSQTFDVPDDGDVAADRALVRRLVHAYADWQQAWMAHADGWMGRRLWGVFHGSGRFAGDVHARVLTNTAYAPPWFGHANAQSLGALVRRGLVDGAAYARFLEAQETLGRRGRYFYGLTGYAYVGTRVA